MQGHVHLNEGFKQGFGAAFLLLVEAPLQPGSPGHADWDPKIVYMGVSEIRGTSWGSLL